MKFPFEATADEAQRSPESFVDAVFSSLVSEFLVMPKGEGFLEYADFAAGYETLKRASAGFSRFDAAAVTDAVFQHPVSLIVLRSILGFSPPEWAYLASEHTGVSVTQNAARAIDRAARVARCCAWQPSSVTQQRIIALVKTACHWIQEGCPVVAGDKLHRLAKADSLGGAASVRQLADLGVPYAMLLYERFLGRPFAAHRDAVSELVGDGLEAAIEARLGAAGITYRKTKRAERIPGFDQAPDFIVPDEFDPRVVIEAKLTEDDGTARDKVTRIIRLCQMAEQRRREGGPGYEVVACLAGRGFGVRREDMRQLIYHTKGKVFTLKTLDQLVSGSSLQNYRTRR